MNDSEWDQVLLQLIQTLRKSLCDTDRGSLLKFCLKNKTTRNAVEEFLKRYKKSSGKDGTYGALKKEEGNEKYKQKKYEECLDLYTESIFHSSKGDECLPLAYSNRSLVLQKLGRPSECLVDIDLALETGYPKRKADVLILRKARCLVQLGEADKAREVLKEALINSDIKEFHHLFQQELGKIRNLKNSKSSGDDYKLPELAGGENKDFVSASNYLSVYYDQTRGRHVIANHDIEAGDVLFVEKPFAFVLLEKGCHNCCKDTDAPIPCWDCSDVSYCSPKCRDDFWKSIHSFECGFVRLLKSVGIARLSLRIILKASSSLAELKKLLKNISQPMYESGIVSYRSKGYDSVFNLVHNAEKYEAVDSFQYFMTALMLSSYLKNCTGYFPKVEEDDDLQLLTSVIYQHILQLICNGHAITRIGESGNSQGPIMPVEEKQIASSIYTSISMMNHSCEPSAISSFHNDCVVVRAQRKIKKGEEVFYCYGPEAKRMKKANRQEILSKQYFFDCKCQECVKKFDMQDIFTAFLCTDCNGPSVPEEENSQTAICLDCGKICDISPELLRKHDQFYSFMKQGEGLLANDLVKSALEVFMKALGLGRDIFYNLHKDLYYVCDQVARCHAAMRNWESSLTFTDDSIKFVEKRFGSCSVELAEEMKKFAKIVICYLGTSAKKPERAWVLRGLDYSKRAENIFNLFNPSKQEELESIKRRVLLERFLQNMRF